MTRGKYFLYPNDTGPEQGANRRAERALPSEHGAELTPPSFSFRAGQATLHRPLDGSAERLADDILSNLSSLEERMSSKKLAVPLGSLLSLFEGLCAERRAITFITRPLRDVTVATCTHGLLFAVGMAVLYAEATALPLELTGGEDSHGPSILLRTDSPSLTAEEAAERFGLSPYRMAVLRRIAAASDFSVEAIPAERSALLFRLPRYTPETYRVFALSDPTLRAAFLLPLDYFSF